jgi:hypothetical protein
MKILHFMKMKTIALTCAAAWIAAVTGFAGPLQKEQVSAEAKWLVHLDVDKFRDTEIGRYVGRELLDPKLAKPSSDISKQFGIEVDWRKIHSITVYGSDLKGHPEANAVVLVQSSLDLAKSLDAVIDKLTESGDAKSGLKKIETDQGPLYRIHHEAFGAGLPGGLFLLSKTQEPLEKARSVLAGKSPNLTATKTFGAFPDATKGFLVLGVSDAFANMPLPDPAKALKNAEGGQIVAGEKAGNLFLNLALNATDAEAATQMQQVFQGLMALALLNKSENKDLQQVTQATKITSNDKRVNVSLELPVATVIAKVTAEQQKRRK